LYKCYLGKRRRTNKYSNSRVTARCWENEIFCY